MKKLMYIFVAILMLFGLMACKDDNDPTLIETEDFSVLLMEEIITFNTIDVYIVIEDSVSSIDELNEIVSSLSGYFYEQHKDEIRSKTYVMTIYLYPSTAAYDTEANDYGYIAYWINRNLETPGLSLHQSSLVYAE